MNYQFRITEQLLDSIHVDLSRRHAFAHERVGFIHCRVGIFEGRAVILAEEYLPVADDDYLPSETMGAVMGSAAIRAALRHAYLSKGAMFHVHRHEHEGIPGFSRVDVRENAKFVPDFWKVSPTVPHGAIVLSEDSAAGQVWCPLDRSSKPMTNIVCVGIPIRRLGGHHEQ